MATEHGVGADAAKRFAAEKALEFVEPNMKLGLGTGSTAAAFVDLLGARCRDGLNLTCVPTSVVTGRQAERAGVPLTTLDAVGWLDLTIDGADEVDPNLELIKGGGGALLIEKIVASASDRMIVIADASKRVDTLGAFPLPVEVTPFAWETTRAVIEQVLESCDVDGRETKLRLARDEPFLTDEGNMIIDLHLKRIGDPNALSYALNAVPGVIDSGLFLSIADAAIIADESGVIEVMMREG
ncbi:MAG: ribose-5-phosphate isomerase RpiA [Rhodobacteraceae bacterium]|nr:ribose-5-phosphate isomerase RpiA [Paracoccaceae bacterium]